MSDTTWSRPMMAMSASFSASLAQMDGGVLASMYCSASAASDIACSGTQSNACSNTLLERTRYTRDSSRLGSNSMHSTWVSVTSYHYGNTSDSAPQTVRAPVQRCWNGSWTYVLGSAWMNLAAQMWQYLKHSCVSNILAQHIL